MDNRFKSEIAQFKSTVEDRYGVIRDMEERLIGMMESTLAYTSETRPQDFEDQTNREAYGMLLRMFTEWSRVVMEAAGKAHALYRSIPSPHATESEQAFLTAHAVKRCEMNFYCGEAKAAWHNCIALDAALEKIRLEMSKGASDE